MLRRLTGEVIDRASFNRVAQEVATVREISRDTAIDAQNRRVLLNHGRNLIQH
jgi:hypothetical protein